MLDFNINSYVWVRLLPRGHAARRAHYQRLGLDVPPVEEDSEGWSRWQLWDLMQEIGSACRMGPEPPFETTIRLEVPQATSRPDHAE